MYPVAVLLCHIYGFDWPKSSVVASRQGKKLLNLSSDKKARHVLYLVGRVEDSQLLCDFGSVLRLRGSRRSRAKKVNGMEKKRNNDILLVQQV